MADVLFTPSDRTLYVTATTTSVATALPPVAMGQSCSIFVAGTTDVGMAFGNAGAAATATGSARSPIYMARCKEGISIPPNATHVAMIVAAGTSDVQIVLGSGS